MKLLKKRTEYELRLNEKEIEVIKDALLEFNRLINCKESGYLGYKEGLAYDLLQNINTYLQIRN